MAAASSSRASQSPEVLNLRGTPAVVEWHDATSPPRSTCYLAQSADSSPIHLNLFFDSSSNTAFFKLRIAVVLEGATPQDEVKTFVYVFIHPEHVLSLEQEEAETLPGSTIGPAARLSFRKIMCLRFVLSKPASVVAPVDVPVRPKSTADVQLLNTLELLVQQNSLAIHVALNALPNPKLLETLCRASSNGSMKSHPKHADLSGLYGGRGGRLVQCLNGLIRSGDDGKGKEREQEKATAAEDTDHLEIPPAYKEAEPLPLSTAVPVPPPDFSRKRRRVSFESASPATDNSNILDICAKLLARQQVEMQNGLLAHMDERLKQMEDRLVERLDQRLDDRLEELKSDICGQVEERMDDRIDGVTADVDALIDERIEDSVLGIKIDLESFVKDEVRNVEDDIRDDLQEGSFTIQFST
ncbi:hypothetical protein VM1G_00075 [Cytospora mali]|uniref:Uncharacterized protein n=1 Tax=Cytospora mali TaxID=578113 RepID=A0A194VLQ8_CYTMA|nr:hypothetical protein VM1G_00075 [Valsa mali]